jgi:hypothetical protein
VADFAATAGGYLRAGVTVEALDRQSQAHSDLDAARQMQQAKRRLFDSIEKRHKWTA